jgi:hypothetical protein
MLDPERCTELDIHPLADADPERVSQLAQKLFSEGYRGEPVVTVGKDHAIVDGRHRVLASRENGNLVPVINISEKQYDVAMHDIPMPSLEDIADKFRGRLTERKVAPNPAVKPAAPVSKSAVRKETKKHERKRRVTSGHVKRRFFGSEGASRKAMGPEGTRRRSFGSLAKQRREKSVGMFQATSVVSSVQLRMSDLLSVLDG